MTLYHCHKCSYRTKKHGLCPECGSTLAKVCGVCGAGIDSCTCNVPGLKPKKGSS